MNAANASAEDPRVDGGLGGPATQQVVLGAILRILAAPALFALVGATSTAIDVGAFWLLTALAHVPPLAANSVSYLLGAVNSFLLNRRMTFRRRKASRSSAEQAAVFVLVRFTCLAVSSAVLVGALHFMPSLAAKLISVIPTFVLAYTLSSRFVYR